MGGATGGASEPPLFVGGNATRSPPAGPSARVEADVDVGLFERPESAIAATAENAVVSETEPATAIRVSRPTDRIPRSRARPTRRARASEFARSSTMADSILHRVWTVVGKRLEIDKKPRRSAVELLCASREAAPRASRPSYRAVVRRRWWLVFVAAFVRYLGVAPARLSLAQSSLLARVIQAPSAR